MERFTGNIDKQLEFNRNKNILLDNLEMFQFSDETVEFISRIYLLNPDSKQVIIDYATDKVVEEFCKVNQYYSFDSKAKNDLKQIYSDLIESFSTSAVSHENISKLHYEKLKKWLTKSNPFAEKIYRNSGIKISPVVCSEYSSELQLAILKIDIDQIAEPVLDIGCGTQGYFVRYLRKKGINAFGIDRFASDNPFLIKSDWFEYKLETEKWGTITSNLGFSNHFQHHHYRNDGDFVGYAKKFMEILSSLKIGGCFHYAPDLPFIEQYLETNKYQLLKESIGSLGFNSTKIKRIN